MTSTPKVIGIDTSGRTASIALLSGDQVVNRRLSDSGRRHARTLLPELKSMVASCGLTVGDVDLVAVTTGPGSFTGLRVGVACAKTFAWACEVPVLGIPTFKTLTTQLPAGVGDGWLAMNAERHQLFVCRVQAGAAGPIKLIDLDEFLTSVSSSDFVSGPLPNSVWNQFPNKTRRMPDEVMEPSAETVARIASTKWPLSYSFESACLTNPVYGRLSAAEENAGDAAPAIDDRCLAHGDV